jgi:hypothetical protein
MRRGQLNCPKRMGNGSLISSRVVVVYGWVSKSSQAHPLSLLPLSVSPFGSTFDTLVELSHRFISTPDL